MCTSSWIILSWPIINLTCLRDKEYPCKILSFQGSDQRGVRGERKNIFALITGHSAWLQLGTGGHTVLKFTHYKWSPSTLPLLLKEPSCSEDKQEEDIQNVWAGYFHRASLHSKYLNKPYQIKNPIPTWTRVDNKNNAMHFSFPLSRKIFLLKFFG